MKKINKILTFIVVFTLCVICGFKKTDVNAASAALTGPGTVRAGDTYIESQYIITGKLRI